MTQSVPELDKLFYQVGTYRSSAEYLELISFVKRFRAIAPYNAMLLHIQNPNSSYVATASDWATRFGRRPKPDARPLVILRPFGPVAFVYDEKDTEGNELPKSLTDPFDAEGTVTDFELSRMVKSMCYSGVGYSEESMSINEAGYISRADYQMSTNRNGKEVKLRQLARIAINKNLVNPSKLATIYHELGHLYCGHIKVECLKGILKRYDLPLEVEEFEAESVCWLLCERQGIINPSAAYLSGYLGSRSTIPNISIETILKAVGQIETIYRGVTAPLKEIIIA